MGGPSSLTGHPLPKLHGSSASTCVEGQMLCKFTASGALFDLRVPPSHTRALHTPEALTGCESSLTLFPSIHS